MVRITALMDDKLADCTLVNEHGLSYLVECPAGLFLFDCGQSAATWRNARTMEQDVYNIDAVILSHSHYDHAGGYPALVEAGDGGSLLYTGEGFFEEKYSCDGEGFHPKGAGFDRDFPQKYGISHQTVSDVTQIFPGVYLIGNFPRVHDFETIPEKFCRKTADGLIPDDFHDEICMAVDADGKLAVLVGCAHPGILNMVEHVREKLGRPVYAVFGGAHLLDADESRIEKTLRGLHDLGVELFGLGHCSGELVEQIIAREPTLRGCHIGVGDSITL